MRQLKFRIWDRQSKRFVDNDAGTHCASRWLIDAFTGRPMDFVVAYEDPEFGSLSEPYDYYIEGTKVVKEPQYDIQQFTGILDTEGREIYEGDILQVLITDEEWLTPSVVGWSKYDEAGYSLANVLKIEDWQKPLIGHTVNGIELTQQYPMMNKGGYKIMGNVFENPELLKARDV